MKAMNYPFTAIAGQEKLKKALLLCAINPAIGGLLIQGDKGTAKSTAARALAAVVPPVMKVSRCLFNCSEDHPVAICEVCLQTEKVMEEVQVPFINLPLGATEERVLGSLDLEAILVEKKKKFQPGLLASVHQGILYIDEVNLLPDHLVDVLLDVSAMGQNIIEREGLSLSHPSRFTLIGTMNPEEGKLRPQFLDRFGLMVYVEAPSDVTERTEVVRRRIAFENDAAEFISRWELKQTQLQQQLLKAKQLLPFVQLADDLLQLISQLATELNVKSLRADIVMYKTAITLAALDQRTQVLKEDILEAAEFVLSHRSRKKTNTSIGSGETPQPSSEKDKPENRASQQGQKQDQSEARQDQSEKQQNSTEIPQDQPAAKKQEIAEQIFEASAAVTLPKIESLLTSSTQKEQTGKRSEAIHVNRGAHVRSVLTQQTTDIAIDATVIHALTRNPDQFEITLADLHQKKRTGKTGNLILFVVDASGSMAARKRMEAVKGTVLSLLTEAYEKRDTVGVIAFRGIEAQILLHPTQSTALAEEAMHNLPTGGRTPLPHALEITIELLQAFNQDKDYHPILIVLTDGKANVPLSGTTDQPWNQVVLLASQLKEQNIQSLVLNTAADYFNLDQAEELAAALGGEYLALNEMSEEQLTPIINQLSYKSR